MTSFPELGRPCAGCGEIIDWTPGEHVTITAHGPDGPVLQPYCVRCSPRLFDLSGFRDAARKAQGSP